MCFTLALSFKSFVLVDLLRSVFFSIASERRSLIDYKNTEEETQSAGIEEVSQDISKSTWHNIQSHLIQTDVSLLANVDKEGTVITTTTKMKQQQQQQQENSEQSVFKKIIS